MKIKTITDERLLELLIKAGFDEIEEDEVELPELSDYAKVISEIIKMEGKIIGGFTNESGEEYILYKFPILPNIYITGSELDYELLYEYKNGKCFKSFVLANDEIQKINSLLK